MLSVALRSKRRIAIDWDSQSLRVVQYRARAEKIEIIKAISVPIPTEIRQEDAESLGAFLRQALEQAGIRERRAALDIPREKVVINTLSVPPTPLDDLPSLVHFQIVKELPFAADQATLDFAIRGEYDEKAPADVLVAAVRNEVLSFYTSVAREAGLSLERIGLRPHANLVAFGAGRTEGKGGRMLGIDVGPTLTEINVIRDGGLVFSRSATVRLGLNAEMARGDSILDSRIVGTAVPNLNSEDVGIRDAVAALSVEITRSVEAYRATDLGARFDRIVVAGATGVEGALAESLHARFQTHAELYNPGAALDLTPQRARELRGFSAAIGLALSHEATPTKQFNFLSPKKAVTKGAKRLRRAPTAVLAASILIVALVGHRVWFVNPALAAAENQRKANAALERELKGYSEQKRRYDGVRDLAKRIEVVRRWIADEGVWLNDLVQLTRAAPSDKDAYVRKLYFSDQPPSIEIDLRAKSATVTTAFVSRLGEMGYEAVVGKSADSRERDGFSYTDSLRTTPAPRRAGSPTQPSSAPASHPAGEATR